MKTIQKYSLAVLLLCLVSCNQLAGNTTITKNDTVEVLNTAIQLGMDDAWMPSVSPLRRKYKFGDSTLLTSTLLPLNLLPSKVGNQVFKVLSRDSICSMIKADTNQIDLPNYLMISQFEKSDTGYYVQVQSLSCLPYAGGGALGMYFRKVNDSLVLVDRRASSIN